MSTINVHSAEPAGVPTTETNRDGEDALRDELLKWRERVPKLAAALRQRADEAQALRQELDRLRREQPADGAAGAGIRARDDLIADLEAKLADVRERYKAARAELHARQIAVEELRADTAGWKEKWQALTRTLDQQAEEVDRHGRQRRQLEEEKADLCERLAERTAAAEAGQRALDEALTERDSLRQRNEQLFETTELANRQITSLTDSLAELRVELKRVREETAAALAEREEAERAQEALGQRLERAEACAAAYADDLQVLCAAALTGAEAVARAGRAADEAERARGAAEQALAEARAREAELQGTIDEHAAEIARLHTVVAVAERTTREREQERRTLSEQLQAVESRAQHLETRLAERSALVVTLEQDQRENALRRETLQQERDDLEQAALRAERHVKENAQYVAQLDGKIERQQELMLELERELAEAKSERDDAARAAQARLDDKDAELESLREQVRKLETVVRERTDALNRVQWQRDVSTDAVAAPGAISEAGAASPSQAGGKMLVVLNQQLADARAHNDQLLVRVRELEAELARRPGDDDLTRIHGVGQKLAEQLSELGFHRLEQIAELDPEALDREDHVLHGHRGRILRDRWIEQAAALCDRG